MSRQTLLRETGERCGFAAPGHVGAGDRRRLQPLGGLIRFFDDGRLELDANIVERAMRPIAPSKRVLFSTPNHTRHPGGRHPLLVTQLDVVGLSGRLAEKPSRQMERARKALRDVSVRVRFPGNRQMGNRERRDRRPCCLF
jgi:hypothetical protein